MNNRLVSYIWNVHKRVSYLSKVGSFGSVDNREMAFFLIYRAFFFEFFEKIIC